MDYRTLDVAPTDFHIKIYLLCLDSTGKLTYVLILYDSFINMLYTLLFFIVSKSSLIGPIVAV